ncbi:RdgB/HAM1 family non-canonical purine NTP pyrophosphatase [Sulfoacidibacillus thermotolerans]|uniref:dITP/XTP pyrophosphatase n=1 Tax=Sulfoacidibacillus thermotolerans TaxID=1765684 RepID=A0A2U3DC51_SULT2|nr:RdgB/HAM1 family non-canonical purine NTP pyrophosphatase [Sulfoacidibacillus thermotolerans]PWI58861.1 non-canonical purine NTP pyrophosphatase, RdgB/HAM1 family [Sulfoacidibacillus thermotolerans]
MEYLVVATTNQGKLQEFKAELKEIVKQVEGLPKDYCPPAEEGSSFLENALVKARYASKLLSVPVLADDSGLVVDALGGAPGIFSARFGGLEASDRERCELLLERMQGIPPYERRARFVAALALVWPDGETLTAIGTCSGEIATSLQGQDGFGYDPVFYYPPFAKTFAQMSLSEKSAISHRGRALAQLRERLLQNGFDRK